MKPAINPYEYFYKNNESLHHHVYLFSPLLDLISQYKTNSHNKLRVLDLGCGNGSLSQKIAAQGYKVVGVEDSLLGLSFASKNFPECSFIQASIYDLPYDKLEKAFDIVIATEVIEHLFYPNELIRSAKRCLKPGGQLIITTPYHGYLKNLVLALLGKMDGHYTVLWNGGHIKFFSVLTLTQLLQDEGLEQINFKFAGRFPYLWKTMLCSSTLPINSTDFD